MTHSDETLIQGRGSAALSRRQMIHLAGLSSALALSPQFAKAAEFLVSDETPNKVSEIMQQLSAHMATAATRPLPEEVSEKAKQHILDTFAAMISGSGLVPGRAALEFARAYGGKQVATVVGSHIVCCPIPTKPTIRMDHHAHIPASPPFQRVLLRAKNTPSAELSSCAQLPSDT